MEKGINLYFIGIGSGKCGSTWLYRCLTEHPEICDKNPKELNYFSYLYKEKSIDWYKKQFKGCEKLLKGEFSVSYMEDLYSAKRIKLHFPDIKLIAILRNPIKKVYSNYLHSIRKREIKKNLSFSEYIQDEKNLFFGNYYQQLIPYYDVFNKDQIYIIILENFEKNLIHNIKELYNFIGVKENNYIPASLEKEINVAKNYKILFIEQIITNISKYLTRSGHTLLVERIKKIGLPNLIRKLNAKKDNISGIDKESYLFLKNYYRNFNSKLQILSGINVSVWK